MAKNTSPDTTRDPGDDFDPGDEAQYLRATTLEEGESIVGYYLGFDTAMLEDGPKKRHRFLLDPSPEDGASPYRLLWQAAMLDGKLGQIDLGVCVRVERTGSEKVINKQTGKAMRGSRTIYSVIPSRTGRRLSKSDESEIIGRGKLEG